MPIKTWQHKNKLKGIFFPLIKEKKKHDKKTQHRNDEIIGPGPLLW